MRSHDKAKYLLSIDKKERPSKLIVSYFLGKFLGLETEKQVRTSKFLVCYFLGRLLKLTLSEVRAASLALRKG